MHLLVEEEKTRHLGGRGREPRDNAKRLWYSLEVVMGIGWPATEVTFFSLSLALPFKSLKLHCHDFNILVGFLF